MVERERLHDRVEFLGYVPHSSVRDVLVRGNVFLNCSLAESFCIAILEAASAGLFVVSTNVGGVSEVLPPEMIHHADPNVDSLVESLSCAISGKIDSTDPFEFHRRVSQMYSWQRVAGETVTVYDRVIARPRLSLSQRLVRYKTVRHLAGFVVWYACWALHCISLFSLWNCGNHGI
jgi:phosphatidylinositol glycan class A protein